MVRQRGTLLTHHLLRWVRRSSALDSLTVMAPFRSEFIIHLIRLTSPLAPVPINTLHSALSGTTVTNRHFLKGISKKDPVLNFEVPTPGLVSDVLDKPKWSKEALFVLHIPKHKANLQCKRSKFQF